MRTTIEVAIVRAKRGVSTVSLEKAALSVQPALPDLKGFIGRELGVSADGLWVDLIHWRSQEEAAEAQNVVMTIPACMDYFSQVESQLDECAMLFEQVCVQPARVPMQAGAIEVVIAKVDAGVSMDRFVAAALAMNPLLPHLYGFVSREFGMRADGAFIDLIYWCDVHAAEAAARVITQVPVCARFFELIDSRHMQCIHFTRLRQAAEACCEI